LAASFQNFRKIQEEEKKTFSLCILILQRKVKQNEQKEKQVTHNRAQNKQIYE
jgi:hypothetical protein